LSNYILPNYFRISDYHYTHKDDSMCVKVNIVQAS
jgi:hypothetical protein